jgi:hypothetical protein
LAQERGLRRVPGAQRIRLPRKRRPAAIAVGDEAEIDALGNRKANSRQRQFARCTNTSKYLASRSCRFAFRLPTL